MDLRNYQIFFKDIILTLIRHSLSGGLQIVLILLIGMTLGPQGNGIYALSLLMPTTLAILLSFGTSPANIYYIASGFSDVRTAFYATSVVICLSTIIGFLASYILIIFYAESVFPGIDTKTLWIAFLSFPFILLLQNLSALFQGIHDFKSYNVTAIVPHFITLFCFVIFAFLDSLNIFTLLISYIVGLAVANIVALFGLFRREEWLEQRRLTTRLYIWRLFSYGARAQLSNIVTFVNYRASLYIINIYITPAATGIYVLAMQFSEIIWLLSVAVNAVFLPRISSLADNEKERRKITPFIARWTLFISAIAAIFLLFIFYFIVKIILGDSYKESFIVIMYLIPGVILMSHARIISNDIAGRGKPELNLYVSIVGALFNIIVNINIVPLIGLTGAAVSVSFSYIIIFILNITIYSYVSKNRIIDVFSIKKSDFIYIKSMIFKRNIK